MTDPHLVPLLLGYTFVLLISATIAFGTTRFLIARYGSRA